jgi:hypothetical protein
MVVTVGGRKDGEDSMALCGTWLGKGKGVRGGDAGKEWETDSTLGWKGSVGGVEVGQGVGGKRSWRPGGRLDEQWVGLGGQMDLGVWNER